MGEVLRETFSICPDCVAESQENVQRIPAKVIEENGIVWYEKECPKHGKFRDKYSGDAEYYKRVQAYLYDGPGIENPAIDKKEPDCPNDCGLCYAHKSTTALANIIVTNRCNLRCFYCFLNCGRIGKVFEPSMEDIGKMLDALREERPVGTKAIQLTGGEPTLREDLVEIIDLCREKGFTHIQINSNGLKLAEDLDLVKRCREAGCNTVYMSFDGTSERTNPWLKETKKAVENCREAGMGVVLVPVIIGGVNDHEVGEILDYALENIEVVRGVNFQPVSFVGRMPADKREKMRVTIPDLWHRLEKHTNNKINIEDFYCVPSIAPLSNLAEALSGETELTLSPHPQCGSATYIFLDDNNEPLPVTRFIDIEKFFEFAESAAKDIKEGGKLGKAKVIGKALLEFNKIIDKSKAPKGLRISSILLNIIKTRSYRALGEFHRRSLFVGSMHFQDSYNYDIERLQRCCIHYVMPDGKIVPFCAFNGLPQKYSIKMQTEHGETFEEYEKRTGRKIADDLYKRDGKPVITMEA